MFRRAHPAEPLEPAAVLVFRAFATALAAHDWAAVAARVADPLDARWRGCGRGQRFQDRESYLRGWREVLSRDDQVQFHAIFGTDTQVVAEFTRRRLNGLSLLSGTIVCDVHDGQIVREFTHEVPL